MVRLEKMDVASRNRRLYEHLKALGLFVAVTSDPDDHSVIDSITVSAGQPKVHLAPFDVCFPLERPEIGDDVLSAIRDAGNVVDFPTRD